MNSLTNFNLIVQSLFQRVNDGLTLTDLENITFFLLFLRFTILAFRHNLKTSFYITLIGLVAGYLWYRHLIDIILMYRQMLVKVPYFEKLGTSVSGIEMGSTSSNIHWYTPGKLLYSAFVRGIIHIDSETGNTYYIDPISMLISNLSKSTQVKVLAIYYKIYNTFIPRFLEAISAFWNQLSGLVAYATITRIGKRYCPYLIRWHWTFLIIIGIVEQILIYFLYRLTYFQDYVIQGRLLDMAMDQPEYSSLLFQSNVLTGILGCCITIHLGFLIFALLHAVSGQYFYFPFLVENAELHIGQRPKNSIYSGGQTPWQDVEQQSAASSFTNVWYLWFGRETKKVSSFTFIKTFFLNQIKKLIKFFGN